MGGNNKRDDTRTEVSKSFSVPIITTIIAALLTFLSSIITSYLNNSAELRLETRRYESSLVLEAIKSGSSENASEMLLFMVETGLLEDRGGNITEIATKREVPIFGRGGVAYEDEFVEELFSKFNETVDLDPVFRAILVEFADNFINHRWNRVATFFDPDLYYEQISLLVENGGDRGIIEVIRQYIHEAIMPVEGGTDPGLILSWRTGPFAINKVEQIYFLDILSEDRFAGHDTNVVKVQFISNDGMNVTAGFIFNTSTYELIHAMG